jgi:hypothetical protein
MDSAEIASIVAIAGMGLSYLGVTGVDSTVINGAINGVIAIVAFGAALWSWWAHRKNNVSQ